MSDILQQLAQLAGPILKSPQGQQMAQAIMAKMQGGGGDPRAQMAQNPMGPPTGQDQTDFSTANARPVGRGPATDMEMQDMEGANQGMSTEGELAQAQQMMGATPHGPGESEYNDNQGHMGMNADGPTPQEVQMLKSKPTPRNIANFNKLFGPGAAEQLLQGGGSTYEDDVRGAMQDPDAANHAKGIYGRKGRGEPLQGNELDDDD